jgi:hypothetical protein
MKKILFQIGFLLVISVSTYAQELGISNINATGKLKVNGNAGTPGQVLTSNGATASPTWNSLTSPAVVTGGKFLIRQGGVANGTSQPNNNFVTGANAPASQTAFIDFISQEYNTNSDVTIDIANDIITINRTGLYHFEGLIRFFTSFSAIDQTPPTGIINLRINTGSNNSVIIIAEAKLVADDKSGRSFINSVPFALDRYIVANQTVKFEVKINGLNFNTLLTSIGINSLCSINGHFVSE